MLEVTFKIGNTGKTRMEKYEMSVSRFIHDAPEWDVDFDSIVKLVVVY
jgi:hypothetical protein